MSLFICERCGHVDSTELAYENRRSGGQFVCTRCQGRQWHGYFPYQPYDPAKHAHIVNHPSLKLDGY